MTYAIKEGKIVGISSGSFAIKPGQSKVVAPIGGTVVKVANPFEPEDDTQHDVRVDPGTILAPA